MVRRKRPKTGKVTLKIPWELYGKLNEIIEGTGFSSVNEFVVFVVRNVASGGRIKDEDKLTANEIRKVRERLKKLGYL
ncbi:MAG: CopG family transcriptional regulator [archaeon]|nr:MAG: CopG family transcriptional regulator [archaeon]